MMEKRARYGFCGDSSLIGGGGEGGSISLFILSKIKIVAYERTYFCQ